MAARPELLDNRSEAATHAAALAALAADLSAEHRLSVATGYLNLAGLHCLASVSSGGRAVRLLLGAAPPPTAAGSLDSGSFDPAGNDAFEAMLAGLSGDRNFAAFPPSRAARELEAVERWLARPEVEVRRYRERFLHGKAYLFGSESDARAALVTSANLTAAGLSRNLELGLVNYQPRASEAALRWFEALWEGASDFEAELADRLFSTALELADPERVFLRALLELFGEDPRFAAASGGEGEEGLPPRVTLADFQREGYQRALRIVRKHHGVIYADGVGSGKTEIGLAFIEEYALHRGQQALVIAPAQLVRYWQERIDRAGLPAQVVSYRSLATDRQLSPADTAHRGQHLHNDKEAYRLVVADEGHAFRNPGTSWYRALSRLLGGEPKDLVLLTATPINNGLWDLYHQVMAFARHDRAFAGHRIRSLRRLFLDAGANARDPESLDPDILFPLADLVSVRRDRRFIEEHYPGAVFPDGTPVRFPKPELATERYDLDAAYPGLVAAITGAIEQLTMARYRPSAYRLVGGESANEAALAGLLRSGILKRFESCFAACRLTVERILTAHEVFLAAWEEGYVPGGEALSEAAAKEIEGAGLAESVLEALPEDQRTPVGEFDPAYERDVRRDRDTLRGIFGRLSQPSPADDPKMGLLARLVEKSREESRSQKIVVFSAFADTIRYLDEQLPEEIAGCRRVTVIGAETDPDQRTRLLGRFCPKTVIAPDHVPEEGEVDLLLTNDVLSEGQNLQQAAAVISYDMPWNPQRVVQRFGRVIRLMSEHRRVYLTTMLPESGSLDAILRLETTIRRKIASAGVYGMEVEVMEGELSAVRAFADRLAGGDSTLLDETRVVEAGQAFSGEGLRAALARWIHEEGAADLRAMRWGTGAVFRQGSGVPASGEPGVFFACRTRKRDGSPSERYWRFVKRNGETGPEPDAAILRRIQPGDAPGLSAPAGDLEAAWRVAVRSIVEEHNRRAEADAAGEPESLGPNQSWALGLLRDPDIPLGPGGPAAAEALAVGRGSIVRRELGEIRRRRTSEEIAPSEAASAIVALVRGEGLRPLRDSSSDATDPPAPLEPISEADVGVVCWMEVLPPKPESC